MHGGEIIMIKPGWGKNRLFYKGQKEERKLKQWRWWGASDHRLVPHC